MNEEKLNGLYLDDTFLSKEIYRLSPLSVYIYLIIGSYKTLGDYKTAKYIARRIKRSDDLVLTAIEELIKTEHLNESDIKKLKLEEIGYECSN